MKKNDIVFALGLFSGVFLIFAGWLFESIAIVTIGLFSYAITSLVGITEERKRK